MKPQKPRSIVHLLTSTLSTIDELMNNKSIGLSQGIALYIAAILGSGVPFLSGVTASMAGPATNLSWLIVIIISFPLAYTFASQAKKYPDVGGQQLLLEIHSDIILGISLGGFTL